LSPAGSHTLSGVARAPPIKGVRADSGGIPPQASLHCDAILAAQQPALYGLYQKGYTLMKCKYFSIFTMCYLLLISTVSHAQIETITSMVRQPFGGSQSPDDARIAAFAKAKREALEQAGTYLESLTIVKNAVLEKDEIFALTAGVLKAEIVSQKNYATADAFGIVIVAKVDVDTNILEERVNKLLKDRKLLKKYQDAQEREKDLLLTWQINVVNII